MTGWPRRAGRVAAAALIMLSALGAGVGRLVPRAPVNHVVDMQGLAYHAADLDVAPGDTVTWVNRDIVPHTATSVPPQHVVDTGTLAAGASGKWVATRAGVYRYTCTFHPTMQGRLVVRAAASPGDQKQP